MRGAWPPFIVSLDADVARRGFFLILTGPLGVAKTDAGVLSALAALAFSEERALANPHATNSSERS
eukprot:7910581-Lingulodinium_polyedra.AAC.1